jgi:hypothetical protein
VASSSKLVVVYDSFPAELWSSLKAGRFTVIPVSSRRSSRLGRQPIRGPVILSPLW